MKDKPAKMVTRLSDEQKARLKEMINPHSNVVFVDFTRK